MSSLQQQSVIVKMKTWVAWSSLKSCVAKVAEINRQTDMSVVNIAESTWFDVLRDQVER